MSPNNRRVLMKRKCVLQCPSECPDRTSLRYCGVFMQETLKHKNFNI